MADFKMSAENCLRLVNIEYECLLETHFSEVRTEVIQIKYLFTANDLELEILCMAFC